MPPLHQKCRFEAWWRSTDSPDVLEERARLDGAEALHGRIHRLITQCVADDGKQDVGDSWGELRIAVEEFIARILEVLDASSQANDSRQ